MRILACSTLALLFLIVSVLHADAEPVDPARFVTVLVSDLVATGRSTDEVSASTEALLAAALDVERISAGVLGRYRSTLEVEQITRFQAALQRSFAGLIARALTAFDDYELAIVSVKEAKGRAQVTAVMAPDSGGHYEAVFALAGDGDSWAAQNLTLNGVNLGLTYRNQFAALMQENGEDFDATLAAWQRELKTVVAAPGE
jgi:phospholipid transport system substrate-binding protein